MLTSCAHFGDVTCANETLEDMKRSNVVWLYEVGVNIYIVWICGTGICKVVWLYEVGVSGHVAMVPDMGTRHGMNI